MALCFERFVGLTRRRSSQDDNNKDHLDFTRSRRPRDEAPDTPWHITRVDAALSVRLFELLLRGTGISPALLMDTMVDLGAFVAGSSVLHLWLGLMAAAPEDRPANLVLPATNVSDDEEGTTWIIGGRAMPALKPTWEAVDIDIYVPTGQEEAKRSHAYEEIGAVLCACGYAPSGPRVPDNNEFRYETEYTDVIEIHDFCGGARKRIQVIFVKDANPNDIVSRFDMNVCGIVLEPLTGFNWTNATALVGAMRSEATIQNEHKIRMLFSADGSRRHEADQRASVVEATKRRQQREEARSLAGRSEMRSDCAADIDDRTRGIAHIVSASNHELEMRDTMEYRISKYKDRGFTVRTSITVHKTF